MSENYSTRTAAKIKKASDVAARKPVPRDVRYVSKNHLKDYIRGPGKGQDDLIYSDVPEGAFVIDASSVSDLGDGSSDSGKLELDKFCSEVWDSKKNIKISGNGEIQRYIPVALSNGEYVVPREIVTIIGGGDNKKGAHILDNAILLLRKKKRTSGADLPPKAHSFKFYVLGG